MFHFTSDFASSLKGTGLENRTSIPLSQMQFDEHGAGELPLALEKGTLKAQMDENGSLSYEDPMVLDRMNGHAETKMIPLGYDIAGL